MTLEKLSLPAERAQSCQLRSSHTRHNRPNLFPVLTYLIYHDPCLYEFGWFRWMGLWSSGAVIPVCGYSSALTSIPELSSWECEGRQRQDSQLYGTVHGRCHYSTVDTYSYAILLLCHRCLLLPGPPIPILCTQGAV